MKITLTKYNPGIDEAPYKKVYDVEYWDKITALEAVAWINENEERAAFDFSCRGRACGRCAMMVDGKAVHACVTSLTDSDHTIEPLPGFPVLRDVVVDKSEAHNRLALRYNRIRSGPISEEEAMTYNMYYHDKINGMEWCSRCLCCQVTCPVYQENSDAFVGPAMMLATAFRFYDPYDQSDRVLEAVQGGLWNCIMCGECTKTCVQAEIDHLAIWNDLRDAATKRGLTKEATQPAKTDGSLIYEVYRSTVDEVITPDKV